MGPASLPCSVICPCLFSIKRSLARMGRMPTTYQEEKARATFWLRPFLPRSLGCRASPLSECRCLAAIWTVAFPFSRKIMTADSATDRNNSVILNIPQFSARESTCAWPSNCAKGDGASLTC